MRPVAEPFDVLAVDETTLDLRLHEVLAQLRQLGPVVWVPLLGAWLVVSREAASAALRDAVTYTVDDPRFSTAQVVGASMLSLDGEEHRRHRDPFADRFRPADVARRDSEHIAGTARRIVSALRANGAAELRRELAGPLAVAVAAGALGLEGVPVAQLLGWYDQLVAAVGEVSQGAPVSDAARQAHSSLAAELVRTLEQPGSWLSEVTSTLTTQEAVANAVVFLFGGIETNEGMTANVLHHLLAHRAQLADVDADRTLVDAAVEESLRLEPAVVRLDRYATTDTVLAGVRISKGDPVFISIAAANRDPAYYPDPDRFDIHRAQARSHLAFAHGPHLCIGATLARLQTRAAVTAVLDMLPGIRLDGGVDTRGTIFRKPLALRVTWPTG
jgi:cytochrome P450